VALTDNILTSWSLDSTTADATGNGHTLTNSGSTPFGAGHFGNCAQFNGSSTYFDIPSSVSAALDNGTAVSISCWFKGSNGQSMVRIQPAAPTYILLGWNNSGTRVCIISSDGGTGSPVTIGGSFEDGSYHMVTMTWEKNTTNGFKVYVDGSVTNQRNSGNVNLPTFGSGVNSAVGRYGGGGEYTTGDIDEINIWTRALSGAEVLQLYSSGPYPFSGGTPNPQDQVDHTRIISNMLWGVSA